MEMELLLGDDISMKLLLSWEKPDEPEPAYDETKIAVIELDENDDPTGGVSYFLSFSDASSYLADNEQTNYDMRVGSEVELSSVPNLTFQDLINLRHVTLSDKIFSVGTGAFQRCSGLKEVYAPEVKFIGQYCFQYCTSLTHITAPNIMSIQESAFIHCESLDNVSMITLSSAVPKYALGYCYNLKTIELSPSLTAILSHAFYGCKSLAYSATFSVYFFCLICAMAVSTD